MAKMEVEAKKAVPFCRPAMIWVSIVFRSRLSEFMIQSRRRSAMAWLRLARENSRDPVVIWV
ncbi:hypothetical protein D3C73_1615710 [compost metagenome]